MKLSDGQTINSSILGQKDPIAPAAAEKPSKTVNANTLQALASTWGKVESSQPLSPAQTQRLTEQTNQTSLSQSQSQSQTKNASGSVISDQIKQLVDQVKNGTQTLADLKLFLVKLETQQGLLTLISQSNQPKGNLVLINQNAQGVWQLQSPPQNFSLSNLMSQFSGNALTPPPIDLAVLSPTAKTTSLPIDSSIVSKPPLTTIQSGGVINAQTAQNAILNSGQSLEGNLLKLAESALQTMTKLGNTPTNTAEGLKLDGLKLEGSLPDFKGRFKQVEQQVNQLVKKLVDQMPGLKQSTPVNTTQISSSPTNLAPGLAPNLAPGLAPGLAPTLVTTANAVNPPPLALTDTNTPATTVATLASDDNKSWLIKNQQQLLTAFTNNLTSNNSFIPNWGSSGQFKTTGELSELLKLLLAPKMNPAEGGKSIWPNNLSVQSQLQQTLQTLITHTPDAEKDSAQSQLLRQILSLSQGLMKVQHDQIHNRIAQQLDMSSPVQMSLPYIHQNQVQWAEMEFKQQEHEDEKKEKTTGWHLILRFAQQSPQSFAIETQLRQNQVSVVLWAERKQQLKNLNTDISLLKEKLNHAGFNIESISSKHGSPVRIQKPIQQSLVDVHT
jgi:hypothetical protein